MRVNKSLITFQQTGAGTGSVTSVAMTVPTGLTISGSPITSSGTLALGFASGVALPPSQTGNAGKYLTTDGTNLSWGNISGTISGTANYVPFFATSSTLGTSPLYYDGSYYMAIGTTTTGTGRFLVYNNLADTHLQVSGTTPSIRITDTPTSATYNSVIGLAISSNSFITNTVAGDFAIANASGGSILFGIGTTEMMRIFTSTGNVSIGGNSTDSGYKLNVQGTSRFTGALYLTGGTGVAGTMSYGATYGLLLYGNTGSNADVTITDRTGALRISVVNGGNIIQTSTTINNISIGSSVVTPSITKGSTYGFTFIGTSATTYDLSLFERTGNNGLFINSSGQIKIGVYNSTFNSSAILEAVSTTKGFLPPRMTNAQRTAISSPAVGLIVYCTDFTEGLYVYKSGGWTFII